MQSSRNNPRFRRRALLKGLGLCAAAAPFVPILNTRAGGEAPPKRLICLFTGNGIVGESWDPSPDFTMGPMLAPLQDYADRLVLINGLRMESSFATMGAGGHAAGANGCLTGSRPELIGPDTDVSLATDLSVDQLCAGRLGLETKLPSLQCGIAVKAPEEAGNAIAYAGYMAPILPENDPQAVYDRVFADFDPDGGLDQAALAAIADKQSVLDLVKGDLARLKGKIGSEDIAKIDAHLEAVYAIESSLGVGAGDWNNEACALPTLGSLSDPLQDANIPTVAQQQIDLLTMAMACDLTRFATLQLGAAGSTLRYSWLGLNEGHHGYSHNQINPNDPVAEADARVALTEIGAWNAGQLKYLLDRLASYPEGDGSMLDNTVVMWVSEIAMGNHDRNDYRILMTDGGYFEGGRLISLDNTAARASTDYNNMLVSVCHAMGLSDVESFGAPEFCDGPLPELT